MKIVFVSFPKNLFCCIEYCNVYCFLNIWTFSLRTFTDCFCEYHKYNNASLLNILKEISKIYQKIPILTIFNSNFCFVNCKCKMFALQRSFLACIILETKNKVLLTLVSQCFKYSLYCSSFGLIFCLQLNFGYLRK